VLETAGVDIGVVVGTVQTRYFQPLITGEPSHVGPTTMSQRLDSLAASAEVILAVEQHERPPRIAAERPYLGSKIFVMREKAYLTARDYIATFAMKTLSEQGDRSGPA